MNYAKYFLTTFGVVIFLGVGASRATTSLSLDSDLANGPDIKHTRGVRSGAGNVRIYLSDDLVLPLSTVMTFTCNTVIDGQGHDIVFEDEAYFKIDGPSGTTLTLRNCNVKGVSYYRVSENNSIMFGPASYQKLILNDVVFNLAGDFEFNGGCLDIVNKVEIKGFGKYFFYSSPYDITINNDSTLFLDFHVVFVYSPSDQGRQHLVMQSSSSNLFLNGCIFAQADSCGLELIKGHLIVDHIVKFYNSGIEKKSWALYLGNGIEASNLNVDILPSANVDVVVGGLLYDNVDNIIY